LRYTRVEVRKVGGVAHSLAWLTRLPTMLAYIASYKPALFKIIFTLLR
jgi:hypothetical protein